MNRTVKTSGSSTMIIFARTASSILVLSVQLAQTQLRATPVRPATSGQLEMIQHWVLSWRMRHDAAPANQFTDSTAQNAHRMCVQRP